MEAFTKSFGWCAVGRSAFSILRGAVTMGDKFSTVMYPLSLSVVTVKKHRSFPAWLEGLLMSIERSWCRGCGQASHLSFKRLLGTAHSTNLQKLSSVRACECPCWCIVESAKLYVSVLSVPRSIVQTCTTSINNPTFIAFSVVDFVEDHQCFF